MCDSRTMLLMAFLGLIPSLAHAQNAPATQPAGNANLPDEMRDVRIDQKPGAQVPLNLAFEDERGQQVQLSQYFNPGRPVILQLGYFGCPMLCGLISRGVVDAIKPLPLRAGTDYEFIYLSINPNETSKLAYLKKQSYISELGKPTEAGGWHLLVGQEQNINQVTESVGWKYKRDPKTGEYAHPAGIIILSPDGKVSRYLNGVLFDPSTLRLSLVEASQGKIGSVMDQFLLVCFHYDASAGKYTLAAVTLMRLGGILTVLILGGIIYRLLRREFAQRRSHPDSPSAPAT
ncbi:MAG: SCO family protein [Bacillota bacterium]